MDCFGKTIHLTEIADQKFRKNKVKTLFLKPKKFFYIQIAMYARKRRFAF